MNTARFYRLIIIVTFCTLACKKHYAMYAMIVPSFLFLPSCFSRANDRKLFKRVPVLRASSIKLLIRTCSSATYVHICKCIRIDNLYTRNCILYVYVYTCSFLFLFSFFFFLFTCTRMCLHVYIHTHIRL